MAGTLPDFPAHFRRIAVRAYMEAWEKYNGLVGLEKLFPSAYRQKRERARDRAQRYADRTYPDAPPAGPTDPPRGRPEAGPDHRDP